MHRIVSARGAHRRLAGSILAFLLLSMPASSNGQEAEPGEQLRERPLDQQVVRDRVYRMNHHHLLQGMRTHVEAARTAQRAKRVARRHPGRAVTGPLEAPPLAAPAPRESRPRMPEVPLGAHVLQGNVRANDPTGDVVNAGQSELALAAIGDQVLVSWNDGNGFYALPGNIQGYAVSSDGGATLVDAGDLPPPSGWAQARWTGDPVVAVDEKRNRFYLAGLAALDRNDPLPSSADSNGFMVARRVLSGGVWSWSTTAIPRVLTSTTYFCDKEWMAADSVSGNVYLIYTLYNYGTNSNSIQFQRSTTAGLSWSTAVTLSSPTDAGDVQGARVACGPGGEVHVIWMHNNPATAMYDIRYRRSTDGGLTFGAEQTAASFVPMSATGAPGFSRSRGIDMPTLAVDRTSGQYRGRVYVGFSEAYNYLDDVWAAQPPANTVRFETEGNNSFPYANAFSAGQTLRGSTGSGDPDCWAVTLTAGQHLLVWMDSTAVTSAYTFAIQALPTDTTVRLVNSAVSVNSALQLVDGMFTFYAPYTGTYYLRISSGFSARAYRIRTKLGSTSGGRGRDRRDPFVTWSQGGLGGWSTAARANDAAIGSDDYLPELTSGADGYPYMAWYDARTDALRAAPHLYASRSTNGGLSWDPNVRLSSQATDFSNAPCNISPNMGDYIGLAASSNRIHAAWADGRGADVDAYTQSFRVGAEFLSCAGDRSLPPGGSATLAHVFQNSNDFYADQFNYAWTDERGWMDQESFYFSLAAGQSVSLSIPLTVPANAANGSTDRVCLAVSNSSGAIVRTCCATITVDGSLLAVEEGGAAFALAPVAPNPVRGAATLRFGLPNSGRVTLHVFDLSGGHVRTLLDETLRAGSHSKVWDGRDDAGRAVPAGVYFGRLEHGGKRAEQRLVMLR